MPQKGQKSPSGFRFQIGRQGLTGCPKQMQMQQPLTCELKATALQKMGLELADLTQRKGDRAVPEKGPL